MRLYFDLGNQFITYTLKCASESICTALRHYPIVDGRHVDQRTHLFVRDPIERLVSAWQFFQQHPLAGVSEYWTIFVDAVLAGATDWHWLGQKQTHTVEGRFIPTDLHRLEDIGQVWPTICDLPIGHRNQSAFIEHDTNYRVDEIMEFYADDYELRAACG